MLWALLEIPPEDQRFLAAQLRRDGGESLWLGGRPLQMFWGAAGRALAPTLVPVGAGGWLAPEGGDAEAQSLWEEAVKI